MVHGASKIGIREADPAERRRTQRFAPGRLATAAEKEARLRTQVGMAPAVQNDSGNVSLRVEAHRREHLRQLLTDSCFILVKRRSQKFRAAAMTLFFRRKSRPRK